ncbi:MAG: O-antigen ligase family protein [Halioglobus sp.]|nr:O-antigen ligase family protein [Halioglobus sp.]
MNSLLDTFGPAALALVAALAVFGTAFLFKTKPIYLLVLHITSRIILDSAPEYTYANLVGGLSLMQFYSVGFAATGWLYLFLRGRMTWHSYSAPLAALVVAYAVSATIHSAWLEFATSALRWFYLWVLIALTLYAMSEDGERSLMFGISVAGLYAFANQMYSVATDSPKWGAGMWTYVGTFKHESDLCFILVMLTPPAFYFLSCSRNIKDKLVGIACLGATCVGLYYGAYRSVWIAFAAYVGLYLWNRYLRGNMTSRAIWTSVTLAGAVGIGVTVGPAILSKTHDLIAFVSNPQEYLDFSGNAEKVGLMSGRVDLINSYMSLYLNSGVHVFFGGIGPGEGSTEVGIYAHNEYLSALVETGLIGLIALLWLMLRYISRASALSHHDAIGAQVAAPFFIVMCVSSLGTMPFRDMRAMLAMGLMMGITEWYANERSRSEQPRYSSLNTENKVTFLS